MYLLKIQAVAILGDLRQAAEQAEEHASMVTTKTTNTAVDKAKARTAATQAARVPDELLRALGARGRGLDSRGRPYGLALLKVVEDVAAEAFACGERSQGICLHAKGHTAVSYVANSRIISPKNEVLGSRCLRGFGRGERHSHPDC